MTKKEMVNAIENSKMVINFSRSYFMSMTKDNVERIYKQVVNK
jgi:hypothetical protein